MYGFVSLILYLYADKIENLNGEELLQLKKSPFSIKVYSFSLLFKKKSKNFSLIDQQNDQKSIFFVIDSNSPYILLTGLLSVCYGVWGYCTVMPLEALSLSDGYLPSLWGYMALSFLLHHQAARGAGLSDGLFL